MVDFSLLTVRLEVNIWSYFWAREVSKSHQLAPVLSRE
jgi:hypothetical protein